MNLIEKATIMHYHRHRVAVSRSGTVEALGWKEEASQQRRFEVITTVGDLQGCSLLDIGCGYGHLKAYLDRLSTHCTYIGIDMMPDFIAEAKARYQGRGDTFFFRTDFTAATFPEVDYVLASGVLGYRCENPDFYGNMIRKMYAAATIAVAFNMLDAAHFAAHALLVGHECERILAFCATLSPHVKLIRGYLEDDFTVFIYKEVNECASA